MHKREMVLQAIGETKVISIIRGIEETLADSVIEALLKGGVRCLEITLNTPGALQIISNARKIGNCFVGAGTVLNPDDAKRSIEAGAQFVLAPNLDREVIKYCLSCDVLPIPGVFSPTELYAAHLYGAELIKIFPSGSVGPQYIKDLLGPFSGVKLLPVGGVSLENTSAFMKAGAYAVGVGSSLASPSLAKAGDFIEIQRRAAQFVSLAKSL